MKKAKIFITIFFITLFSFSNGLSIFAMETGFSTTELSNNSATSFISNINLKKIDSYTPKNEIECFDVNSNEMIALGFKNSENKTIGIYNTEGIFQYGYEFQCYGTFGVEWDNDNLNIYFVRENIAISVNSDGIIQSILEIQNTTENNTYWNKNVFQKEKTVDQKKFLLQNNKSFFSNINSSSYSQIISIDAYGNEKIIYNVNTEQTIKDIDISIGIIFTFIIVAIIAIIKITRTHRTKTHK